MPTTSQVHDVKVALVDALSALPALAGVGVYSAEIRKDHGKETIEFFDAIAEQKWGAQGKLTREERLQLLGMVYVKANGGGEDQIRVARARAFALWAEVETYLRADPTIGNVVLRTDNWGIRRCVELAEDTYRVCALFFEISTFNQLRS